MKKSMIVKMAALALVFGCVTTPVVPETPVTAQVLPAAPEKATGKKVEPPRDIHSARCERDLAAALKNQDMRLIEDIWESLYYKHTFTDCSGKRVENFLLVNPEFDDKWRAHWKKKEATEKEKRLEEEVQVCLKRTAAINTLKFTASSADGVKQALADCESALAATEQHWPEYEKAGKLLMAWRMAAALGLNKEADRLQGLLLRGVKVQVAFDKEAARGEQEEHEEFDERPFLSVIRGVVGSFGADVSDQQPVYKLAFIASWGQHRGNCFMMKVYRTRAEDAFAGPIASSHERARTERGSEAYSTFCKNESIAPFLREMLFEVVAQREK